MTDDHERQEQEQARPRPRVVDKRVSAGGSAAGGSAAGGSAAGGPAVRPHAPTAQPAATPAPSAAEPTPPQTTSPATETARQEAGSVWTPEQEAEARKIAEEIAATPAVEWVVNASVSLANIAATKLDLGQVGDAQIAIDALTGIMKEVGSRLGNVEQPLRQTLAQLQMAYAEKVTTPPPPSVGSE